MFENLIEILKNDPRKIVYTEGSDARILESAARLKKDGFLTPILVGNVDEVKAAAEKGGFDIDGLEIIDPATYEGMDAMVEEMVALRKGKMSEEDCRAALLKGNYFGTMLVKMGIADCLLGGATYSTADTVRPALQLVKTKKGAHLVSSCFIMIRGDETLAMGDSTSTTPITSTRKATSPLPQLRSWQRSQLQPQRPQRYSALTRRSQCSLTPPRAAARVPMSISSAMPPRKQRSSLPSSR